MKFVAYFRVSTQKQAASGLGLEGQKAAVLAYATQTGASVLTGYTEVESGKKKDRPELAKAIAHAKRSQAVLCVAKLDRLLRSLPILVALREAKVAFVACDDPHANELTVDIKVVVAQDELRKISERTKAALAAAKARGVKLGSARPGHWQGREQARLAGLAKASERAAQVNRRAANDAYADIYPVVSELRDKGFSLRAIAAELNAMGHTTRRGKSWNPMQVSHVLDRAA